MLEIVLTLSESDQYSSAPKEISKFPLMYMTGYFCRSVYHIGNAFCTTSLQPQIAMNHTHLIYGIYLYMVSMKAPNCSLFILVFCLTRSAGDDFHADRKL